MDSRICWESAPVLGFFRWRSIAKVFCVSTLILLLGGATPALAAKKGRSQPPPATSSSRITETAPPAAIEALRPALEDNQPQVSFLSPKPNEVLTEDSLAVRFQVKDLPIFKDKQLGLGPHLHVLLDNLQYQAVYDLSQPLVLENLSPGTHTLRAFASRPWHESFKNDGAYAQVTFHVFAKTQENSPDPKLPLLTYSRPQGSYGAEPILLDFYLTNAPLHLVAQEDDKDDIADWRIRATVNGESFVIDRWQPLYLKGFKPGKNWVQLEFLDEKGNPIANVFNNTVRVVTYDPNGKDTLARLVRGDLTAEQARGIVDPNYVAPVPKPLAAPSPTPSPSPSPKPLASPSPTPSPTPSPAPSPTPSPKVTVSPSPAPSPTALKVKKKPTPSPSPTIASPTPKPTAPAVEPSPIATPPTLPLKPTPVPSLSPERYPIVPPAPSPLPDKSEKPEQPQPEQPLASPQPEPIEKATQPDRVPPVPASPRQPGFFNRLRLPFGDRSAPQAEPVPSTTPAPEKTPAPSPAATPEVAPTPIPKQLEAPAASDAVLKQTP